MSASLRKPHLLFRVKLIQCSGYGGDFRPPSVLACPPGSLRVAVDGATPRLIVGRHRGYMYRVRVGYVGTTEARKALRRRRQVAVPSARKASALAMVHAAVVQRGQVQPTLPRSTPNLLRNEADSVDKTPRKT